MNGKTYGQGGSRRREQKSSGTRREGRASVQSCREPSPVRVQNVKVIVGGAERIEPRLLVKPSESLATEGEGMCEPGDKGDPLDDSQQEITALRTAVRRIKASERKPGAQRLNHEEA